MYLCISVIVREAIYVMVCVCDVMCVIVCDVCVRDGVCDVCIVLCEAGI